jgi:uncharacterized protein (DUF305 family)
VSTEDEAPAAPAPAGRGPLRVVLLAVIAVALVVLGGAGAVALGIGRTDVPGADSVDAGFARDMSTHHLQGVEMANLALTHAQDPRVRSLGFDISATQTNQVGRMQGWLSLWGVPVSGGTPMAWMNGTAHDAASSSSAAMPGMDMGGTGTSGSGGALMPGMATEAELTQLGTLSGQAFDVQFLRLMIRHHQGGLQMAQYAQAHAEIPAVRSLARSIAETQTAETTTMAELLTEFGGTPLPAP